MKKKIIIGIIISMIGIISIIIGINLINTNENCNEKALQFKKEYEKYNNKEITYNEKKYKLPTLNISKDNPMRVINKKDLLESLDSKTGIIMFSSPIDYTSRTMLEILLEISESFDCKIIYYYDIDELNDEALLQKLINKTSIENLSNGTIIFFDKGKIKEKIVGISEKHEYGKKISEEEKQELKRNMKNGFNSINGSTCEKEKQC